MGLEKNLLIDNLAPFERDYRKNSETKIKQETL